MGAKPAERGGVLFLQLPSPPYRDLLRGYAGGFGVALPSERPTVGHGELTLPSLPLTYAASAAVRRGLPVTFLDAEAASLTLAQLRERVGRIAPSVIVSWLSLPSLRFDLSVLAVLKRRYGCAVVGCGTVCRPPETLADVLGDGTVDVAVTGDAEVVVTEVLDQLLGGRAPDTAGTAVRGADGGIARAEGGRLSDLSVLPVPAFGMLPMGRYRNWEFGRGHHALGKQFGGWPRFFPLYLTRGCPHACPYCPYPLGLGRRCRYKPVEQVLEELTALRRTGTALVVLRDQNVAEDVAYLEAVCEAIVRSGLDLRFTGEARPASLGPATLRLMRRAGFQRIAYGIETGDTTTFASEAKRGVDPTAVERSLAETVEAGIEPQCHFLLGFPEDDWRVVAATIDFIRRNRVAVGECALMTPYPGTPHYERMRAEGRIRADSWDDFTGVDPIVEIDGLSPVEMATARWRILAAIASNSNPTFRGKARRVKAALAGQPRAAELTVLLDNATACAVRWTSARASAGRSPAAPISEAPS